jgi:excisionase family DNA binding protein
MLESFLAPAQIPKGKLMAIAVNTTKPVDSPYLTVREAAEYLRCGHRRIYDLVAQGRLSPLREGGRLLLTRKMLDALID